MKVLATILLINTLCAILDHIEQTPELDHSHVGLVEFKRTLSDQIDTLRVRA